MRAPAGSGPLAGGRCRPAGGEAPAGQVPQALTGWESASLMVEHAPVADRRREAARPTVRPCSSTSRRGVRAARSTCFSGLPRRPWTAAPVTSSWTTAHDCPTGRSCSRPALAHDCSTSLEGRCVAASRSSAPSGSRWLRSSPTCTATTASSCDRVPRSSGCGASIRARISHAPRGSPWAAPGRAGGSSWTSTCARRTCVRVLRQFDLGMEYTGDVTDPARDRRADQAVPAGDARGGQSSAYRFAAARAVRSWSASRATM